MCLIMVKNVVKMAYRGNGCIATTMVVRPIAVSTARTNQKAHYDKVGEDHDPWESEVFAIFIDLFGKLSKQGSRLSSHGCLCVAKMDTLRISVVIWDIQGI